ncbi:MAG: RtcB family protein [Deltaproteobacteria bacterium]|nr:MAG: RtcB family protein [Deltaproteobacteria bacterium]
MAGKFNRDAILHRTSETTVTINNPHHVPTTLYARDDVPIEKRGVQQLLQFLSLQETLSLLEEAQRKGQIAPFWGDTPGQLEKVVLTPDFHKGGGIPIGTVAQTQGFVLPQAVGNDICCGMRLLVTDLKRGDLEPHLDALEPQLRGIFFEGKRTLPMSPKQRGSLLRDGLWGVLETFQDNENKGLWKYYDPTQQEEDLERVHFQGVLPAQGTFSFDDYIEASGRNESYDAHLGSVGGGNHFVELQVVEDIMDGVLAHAWGVSPDNIAIMVHSGSIGLGYTVGRYFLDKARIIYPKELSHPDHGFYALPTSGPHAHLAQRYWDAMSNAANFAFGNRLFLGLMAVRGISEVLGRKFDHSLVYDAPHNLIWDETQEGNGFIHRKGACPAYGLSPNDGMLSYTGQPVIIPGSMGASSYLLAGTGNQDALNSACHGAGRSLARGQSRKVSAEKYEETFASLRVVTPIDPNDPTLQGRQDILDKYHNHLKEEAPFAYKSVTSVVKTVEDADIASPVARLWPLLTVKG